MPQHDFDIANQSAPNFRADLNNALEALGTLSSGSTAPATTYANQLWYDTANNTLKMRNEADSAWIELFDFDQGAGTATPSVPNVLDKVRAWVNFDGTGTVSIRESFNVSSITDNGTGYYTVNFTTAMPDANYAAQGTASGPSRDTTLSFGDDDGPSFPVAFTTTALTVYVNSSLGAPGDAGVVAVSIFR